MCQIDYYRNSNPYSKFKSEPVRTFEITNNGIEIVKNEKYIMKVHYERKCDGRKKDKKKKKERLCNINEFIIRGSSQSEASENEAWEATGEKRDQKEEIPYPRREVSIKEKTGMYIQQRKIDDNFFLCTVGKEE